MRTPSQKYYMENKYRIKCQRLEKIIKEKDSYIKKLCAIFNFQKPKLEEKQGRPRKYRMLRRI